MKILAKRSPCGTLGSKGLRASLAYLTENMFAQHFKLLKNKRIEIKQVQVEKIKLKKHCRGNFLEKILISVSILYVAKLLLRRKFFWQSG